MSNKSKAQQDPPMAGHKPKKQYINDDAVADYLLAHPDFFDTRGKLLTTLRVKHPSGEAVSLIERQVDLLRRQNRVLDRRLVDLVEVARSNDALVERLHHLSTALLSAEGLGEQLRVLDDYLRSHFGAARVHLLVFVGEPDALGLDNITRTKRDSLTRFRRFLDENKPFCGHLRSGQLEVLFGERAAQTRSAALIPIGHKARFGMLALGSDDAEHFSPMLGTVFLGRIGELTENVLAPLIAQ